MIQFAPHILLTLVLALGAAAAMWFLYRRGSPNLRKPFVWLLPMLRSSAVFLLVITLAEPMLRRSVDQQLLSQIRFIVDDSASMNVSDANLPLDKKVEIGLAHGWLDQSGLDLTKLREAQRIAEFRSSLLKSTRASASLDQAKDAVSRLAEADTPEISVQARALLREDWIPSRARQIQAQLNRFTRNLSEIESKLRAEFREAAGDLDLAEFDQKSRIERVRDVLKFAADLEGEHEVVVETAGTTNGLTDLTAIDPPGANAAQTETLVLLSDGRHHADSVAPGDAAALWFSAGAEVLTVGFGSTEPAADLILTNTHQPRRVAPGDTIRGTIEIYDSMPAGQQLLIEIANADEVVWSDELETNGEGSRILAFAFQAPVEMSELPKLLSYTTRIQAVEGEFRGENNSIPMPVFLSMPTPAGILVLDGRPRWEARYIRNIFERDPNWRVESNFAPQETALPTREELAKFDLIVIGEVPAETVSDQHIAWFEEFVRAGGGLIFIDGPRQELRAVFETRNADLSPVTWFDAPQWMDDPRLELTRDGTLEPALTLASNRADNEAIWSYLPAPQRAIRVHPKAGATVLAEVKSESGNTPLLISQTLGDGQILHVASDESWRWRYQKGDEYHTRFWRQLARWVMAEPFLVASEGSAFDVDQLRIRAGESVRVRARNPASTAAEAVLLKDGEELSRVSIDFGRSAAIEPPGPGFYELRLASAELPQIPLTVVAASSLEETITHADQQLLAEMARRGGGEFFAEEDFRRLPEILASKKAIVTQIDSTAIWQTFSWLALIVILVSTELFFRKRAGLL
ncbi:MAG: putative membrane protein [Verrucomicrobiales bacterium]|jgi:uncharacterized membrane protein